MGVTCELAGWKLSGSGEDSFGRREMERGHQRACNGTMDARYGFDAWLQSFWDVLAAVWLETRGQCSVHEVDIC